MFANVNWIAIAVATVVHIALGMWWYSPKAFGRKWMKLMKITKKDMAKKAKKGMGKQHCGMVVSSFVFIFVLNRFVGDGALMAGVQTGLWLWLGFIATTMLGSVLWEGKKMKLYYINTGYYLVSMAVNGAILAML